MKITVGSILSMLDTLAPFDWAESSDNVGLLVGNEDHAVDTIYMALDVTQQTIENAQANGAQLLITHHPIFFQPVQRITRASYDGAAALSMARAGIAHIAMHTNWDKAPGGVTETLARKVGLMVLPCEERLLYMRAQTTSPITLGTFTERVQQALHFPIRVYGDTNQSISSVWLAGGSAGDTLQVAISGGADCILLGEIKHHEILPFLDAGVGVIEAGHAPTELPGVDALAQGLQRALDTVQCKVRVFVEKSRFLSESL